MLPILTRFGLSSFIHHRPATHRLRQTSIAVCRLNLSEPLLPLFRWFWVGWTRPQAAAASAAEGLSRNQRGIGDSDDGAGGAFSWMKRRTSATTSWSAWWFLSFCLGQCLQYWCLLPMCTPKGTATPTHSKSQMAWFRDILNWVVPLLVWGSVPMKKPRLFLPFSLFLSHSPPDLSFFFVNSAWSMKYQVLHCSA